MIMKSIVLIFLALIVSAIAEDKYTTKYDNVDVDQIIRSDRLMHNYVKCLLDKGRCSQDGMELKRVLPDALNTGCSKCNEKQRSGSHKIINHLIQNKPNWWNDLEAKYDKDGSYRKKYDSELKKEN